MSRSPRCVALAAVIAGAMVLVPGPAPASQTGAGATVARHKHHKQHHHRHRRKKPGGAGPGLRIAGNRFVDRGRTVRLLGANRSGTEYACAEGFGTFDSPDPADPDSDQMVAAMASWKMTAVRVPLNEQCWLGIGGVSPQLGGEPYRQRIQTYVQRLHAHGLYAILDLHVAAPGSVPASSAVNGLRPMPDADHSPAFWASVATRFLGDGAVVFDIYNEPHDVSWPCLRDGCFVASDPSNGAIPGYQAAGMQSLVSAVRATGSRTPLMVGGLGYSGDLSQWRAYEPSDPQGQIAASFHNYEGPDIGACFEACWERTIAPIALATPVVTGETGDSDLSDRRCDHDYLDRYLPWADAHGVSYLGWAWDATRYGYWKCGSGPALIYDYDGTPTGYGVGLRDHLRSLPGQPGALTQAQRRRRRRRHKQKKRRAHHRRALPPSARPATGARGGAVA